MAKTISLNSIATAKFKEFRGKVTKRFDTVCKSVAIEMADRIIDRSPVDTGKFRANWRAFQDSPQDVQTEDTDKQGLVTKLKIRADVANFRKGADIYIVNSLPYFFRLEYESWSDQAPNGMVRITALEFSEIVRKAVERIPK